MVYVLYFRLLLNDLTGCWQHQANLLAFSTIVLELNNVFNVAIQIKDYRIGH